MPLHAGATTKILMAYLPEDSIRQIIANGLQSYTKYTVCDPDELLRELAVIREQGYSISANDFSLGGMGIAVPIQDYTGNVVAGLSISGLELRMSKESDRLVWLCQQAAFEISKRMGSR